MDFPQRNLRKNHKRSLPTSVLYLDVETEAERVGSEQRHRLQLAWSCYCRYDADGDRSRELWTMHTHPYQVCKEIENRAQRRQCLWLVGHNVFFDLQAAEFFHWFTLWEWKLEFVHDQQSTYLLILSKEKKTIRVVSTTNYWKAPLKDLGAWLGIEKGEWRLVADDEDALSRYCHTDVEICRAAFERFMAFVVEHDLGAMAMTRNSQAYRAFRHRFMDHKIAIHENQDIKRLERDAYHGGRCETFRIGPVEGGPFLHLDVNAMYPFVMSHLPVPTRLVYFEENVPPDRLAEATHHFLVIAECEVDTTEPVYPVRIGTRLVYPVGRFTTTLATAGVQHALGRGDLVRAARVSYYLGETIFTPYVEYFWQLRREAAAAGDPMLEGLAKLMMNSLYGKFGQHNPKMILRDSPSPRDYWRMDWFDLVWRRQGTLYRLLGKEMLLIKGEGDDTAAPAICAHVTEYARFYLWELMHAMGPDRVMYVDTDELIVQESYADRIDPWMRGEEMGGLKLVERTNTLWIWGVKHYRTDSRHVWRGVPRSAVPTGHDKLRWDEWVGQSGHMQKRITRYALVREKTIRRSETYLKGRVLPSGHVVPFHVQGDRILPAPAEPEPPPSG